MRASVHLSVESNPLRGPGRFTWGPEPRTTYAKPDMKLTRAYSSIRNHTLATPLGRPLRVVKQRRGRRIVDIQSGAHTIRVQRRDSGRYEAGFEPLTARWLARTVRRGWHCVDVGASVGALTLLFGDLVGPDGSVTAIEPAPRNLELLARNVRSAACPVRVIAAACGSSAGTVDLSLTESSDSNSLFQHPLAPSIGIERVEMVVIDDLVTRVDLLKIDTEGAELDVLEGARRTLAASNPRLLVEWAPQCQRAAGRDPLELLDRIASTHAYAVVFDEVFGRTLTIVEARSAWIEGRLPTHWYANIAA